MATGSYWTNRVTRRRTLVGGSTALGALATSALVGCGDDDDDAAKPASTSSAPASSAGSATSAPNAPAEQPKRGGRWQKATNTEPIGLDPGIGNTAGVRQWTSGVYSRLLMYKSAPGYDPRSGDLVGDVAASYEIPAAGDQIVFKIRPNAKWHPPVSRALTADDIVFSYKRHTGGVPGSKAANNAATFTSVFDSVTATDASTVVFKLKKPYVPALQLLGDPTGLPIVPTQIGTAFDPTKVMVGSGPWIFESYKPGAGMSYKRNPEWHFGPERPYLDGIDTIIIPEPANQTNQFLAGNIDTADRVLGADLGTIYDRKKDTQVQQDSIGLALIGFSGKDPSAPFLKDPRVRRAMSMALDRQGITLTAFQLKSLPGAIKPSIQWSNFVPPKSGDYWLDPRGKDMPKELADSFAYDISNAKKLLSAAGVADGFETAIHYPTNYLAAIPAEIELAIQMWAAIGIKVKATIEDPASQYAAKTRIGDFDGLAYLSSGGTDPASWIELFMTKAGLDTGKINDAGLTSRFDAVQSTFDTAKRKTMLHDLQKYLDEQMFMIPMQASSGPQFYLAQPNIKNYLTYIRTAPGANYSCDAEGATYWWKA